MTPYSALEVAKHILSFSEPEVGDFISNLKLQKLLYYCQGFHLALYDKPLFSEKILKWAHGPVVNEVYQQYKRYASDGIPCEDIESSDMDETSLGFISEIYATFGQFSAWKLRDMTHLEPPWKDAEPNEEITKSALKDYFDTRLENVKEG